MSKESKFKPRLLRFLNSLEPLLKRLDVLLPALPEKVDWSRTYACQWRRAEGRAHLQPVAVPHALRLADLHGIERQKTLLQRNTLQFLRGLPANNVLLWGSRGTGKSSIIKALLTEYAADGLRLIEVDKQDLVDLTDIVALLRERPERFVLYCDDLSFEEDDASYKALKSVLDGSVAAAPDNVLLYATSNRRHLLPEFQHENQQAKVVNGEIHHGEAVEEKISLSERFGLWLSFYPFNQDEYLEIVRYWLQTLGLSAEALADEAEWRKVALQWALQRGSRSGRVAWQFARDWVGQQGLRDVQ